MGEKYTTLYISISKDTDDWINNYIKEKSKQDKKFYSKKEIIKKLIEIAIDVENEKYIKIDPKMDEFISQLQKITIEKDGEKFVYEKSKQQVYFWLIEKGLEHLED